MKKIVIFLIKSYQWLISPLLGANCRFDPTCSQYTIEAFEKYGLFKATYLSISRIIRCNPFSKGGSDPLE